MFVDDEQGLERSHYIAVTGGDGIFNSRIVAVESEWSSVSPVASIAGKINTRAPSSAFLHFVHCIHTPQRRLSA
jgi:hypothetical protein